LHIWKAYGFLIFHPILMLFFLFGLIAQTASSSLSTDNLNLLTAIRKVWKAGNGLKQK
jgi:hypothetical protein